MVTKKKKSRDDELLEIKDILTEQKERLLEQLANIEASSSEDVAQLSGDSADVASVEIMQNSLSKIGSRQKTLLKKIDEALAKFDDGTFGICELTGEEIPIARLRVRPVARYTVEAKERLERQEKRYAAKDNEESGDGISDSWEFEEDDN